MSDAITDNETLANIEAIDQKLAEITKAVSIIPEPPPDISYLPSAASPCNVIPAECTDTSASYITKKFNSDQLDLQRTERLFERVRHLYDIGVLGQPHSFTEDSGDYDWKKRFRHLLPTDDLGLADHENLYPLLRSDSDIETDPSTPRERLPQFSNDREKSAASPVSVDTSRKSQRSQRSRGSISSFLREDYIKHSNVHEPKRLQ